MTDVYLNSEQHLETFNFVEEAELFEIEPFLTFTLCTYAKVDRFTKNCLYA